MIDICCARQWHLSYKKTIWSEKANCEFVYFMVNSLRRKRKKTELPIFALAIKFKKGHHIYELRIKIMWTSIQVMT